MNFIFVNIPHRTHKCTNTLYDYAIINYQYLCVMYELQKIGNLLKSKSVLTGPSSYEKRIYRAAVSQRLRNTDLQHSFSTCGKRNTVGTQSTVYWHSTLLRKKMNTKKYIYMNFKK